MLIGRAPLRISFIGGGTDIPKFYNKYGGEIFGCAINKYIWTFANKLSEKIIILKYSKSEVLKDKKKIKHRLIKQILNNYSNENIDLNFIADIRGFYGKQRAIQIDKAVERARIKHVLHQQIDTLSKGYKRRVGLSQAIMHEPKILILDEPTDGLDPNQKHHVRELITEISKTTAIIVSTHILEEVDAVCSSVLLINKGNVVLNGSSSELRSKVDSNNSIMIKIDPKSTEDLKRLLLTIPNISKIEVLNETGSNVNINVYPKENRVILTEVAKIIADHKFPVRDIYQNHIALDEAFRKLTV